MIRSSSNGSTFTAAFTYDDRVRDCVAPRLKMRLVVGVEFEHRLALR